jgi:dTDP-4-dehydrorhamnose 3,5-epimerase
MSPTASISDAPSRWRHDPSCDRGIAWDDPHLTITWPVTAETATLSERDRSLPGLAEQTDLFEYV